MSLVTRTMNLSARVYIEMQHSLLSTGHRKSYCELHLLVHEMSILLRTFCVTRVCSRLKYNLNCRGDTQLDPHSFSTCRDDYPLMLIIDHRLEVRPLTGDVLRCSQHSLCMLLMRNPGCGVGVLILCTEAKQ